MFYFDNRYDRSQPRDNRGRGGRPHFSMPPDAYHGPPPMGGPPAPIPPPGYGHPHPHHHPRPDHGGPPPGPPMPHGVPDRGYNPKPAAVDASGPSSDTAKHAK